MRAHGAKQGKRKNNEEKLSPKTQEKTHAADTPQIIQNIPFWEPKWLPKSIPGPFVSLLAPGFAQDRPQDASKSALGSFRGAANNFRRTQSRPKTISQQFFAVLKTEPSPVRGGTPCSVPACWLPFLENRCWRLGGVQKSRSPGFQGPLLGLGGEAKASPTTSKLVV